MNKKTNRNIIAIFLCLIILIVGFYIIKNKDEIFCATIKYSDDTVANECKHLNGSIRTKYQYPDGCIEDFLNTELITPECDLGRIHRANMEEDNSWETPTRFNNSEWNIMIE